MAQEIGAIEIGIGVNVSKLRSELASVESEVKNRKFAEKEVPIRVRLHAPSDDAIKRVQQRVVAQLNKAGKGGAVTLTPTLVVTEITAEAFVKNLQAKIGNKEVAVPITADVDPVAIRAQIREAIGVVDIGLKWHWVGKRPGGGGGAAGQAPGPDDDTGGGGGGGGMRRGFRTGPRPVPPAGGAPVEKQVQATQQQTEAVKKQTQAVQKQTQVTQQATAATQKQAAQSAPAQATAASPGSIAGATRAGTSTFAGARKAPLADAARPAHTPPTNWMTRHTADPTIERALERMKSGDAAGITDLMSLGGKIENGGIQYTKRSVLGKAPQEQRDAVTEAFMKYQGQHGAIADASEYAPPSRSGMGGAARRLASPIGIDPETAALNKLLQQITAGTSKHQGRGSASLQAAGAAQRYRSSDVVQDFKAKVNLLGGGDSGFLEAVLGPETGLTPIVGSNAQGIPTLYPSGHTPGHEGDPAHALYPSLRDAIGLLGDEGGTDVARAIGRHHMATMFAHDPGYSARLVSASRGREVNSKTGEEIIPNPQDEAMVAALQAIFGEAAVVEAPRVAQRDKAYRKEVHGLGTASLRKKTESPGRSMRGGVEGDLDAEGMRALRAESRRLDARVTRRAHLQDLVKKIAYERAHPFGPGLNLLDEPGGGRNKFGQFNFPFSRRAEGGVLKATGLLGRMAAAGHEPSIAMLGERGPEMAVTDPHTGQTEIIPAHKVPTWLQRAQQGKGLAKDLTGHADGGVFPKIQPLGGGRGTFAQRMSVAASAAMSGGMATAFSGVQRVAVVNWPSALSAGIGSSPASASAGGTFTQQQMSSIGQMMAHALAQAAGGGAGRGGGGGRGGRGGGGGAGGAAAGGGGGGGGFTALEQAQLDAQKQDLITAERLKQKEIAARISASIREAPTRGVQTATGEVSAINLGGLRGVIERRRLADESATRATAALNLYAKAQDKLNNLVVKEAKAQDPQKRAAVTKSIDEQRQAVEFLEKRYHTLSSEAEDLGKNVISGSDKIKIFGANLGGIVAGTFLYSAAIGAVTAGIGGLSKVLAPAIERMFGFQNVAAKITGELSDQAKAAGGDTKATLAQAEAITGMSAATAAALNPQLQSRVSTEAGNKSLAQQIDLIHTAQAIGQQNKGLPADRGLFSTTGGAFGSDLFGTASTAELLTNELNTLPSAADRANRPKPIPADQLNSVYGSYALPNNPLDDFNKALKTGTDYMDAFNEDARKGGESVLKLAQVTQEQANASAAIAGQSPALQGLSQTLRDRGLALQGATKPEDFVRFLQAINTGSQTPDAGLLLQQVQSRQIPNQLSAINAEEEMITRPTLGAQQALEFLGNRPLPFGAGIVPVSQGVSGEAPFGAPGKGIGKFPGVDQNAQNSFNQYAAVATSALDKVIAKAHEGEQALQQLGVPPELVSEMSSLGETASGIELGMANRQAAFDAAQYNRQLFQLNRNLADAVALTGKRAGAEGTLGRLQRENFEISKRQQQLQMESTALGLALSQKQINFQRALAGFQAPGETAEERAARIKEAQTEADYAQKQLNIQKQLFALGKSGFKVNVRIFDVSAQRQVQDLRFALAELQQSRRLSLDTRAAQQALAAVRARQAQVNAQIGIAIDKSTKRAAAAIGTALDIANQSGEAFSKILGQTAQAWGVFVKQGAAAISALSPRPAAAGSSSSGVTHNGANAPGYFGTVSSATSMIVGEAGTETIAVLRNPRIHSLMTPRGGGGSGGGTIIIDVHDNHMSGDQDAEKLVAKISRAVEQSINRKGALLSLRTV